MKKSYKSLLFFYSLLPILKVVYFMLLVVYVRQELKVLPTPYLLRLYGEIQILRGEWPSKKESIKR
jgi:hypothetical protein